MFYLAGLGLKPSHLSIESQKILKKCRQVFLDNFTSAYSEGSVKDLEKLIGRKIIQLDRQAIEQGFQEHLLKAKAGSIALCVIGNALTATTHIQLLLDAKRLKVPFQVLSGLSLTNFVPATGLQEYKFGQIVTIPFWEENFKPESFYDKILENMLIGLHSLCLLDLKKDKNKLMTVQEALQTLKSIEDKRQLSNIKSALLVAISSAGSSKQKIIAGTLDQLIKQKFSVPASLIVCGKLNEKELEALHALSGLKD